MKARDAEWSTDTFREEDHPRDPKGTSTGGQFTSKNATPAPAKPKGPTTDELLAKENRGTVKERVDMRRALKTETDPAKRKALQEKILASMKLQYDKTGDATLLAKMDKYSKIYLSSPKPKGVVVPEKGKYSPEEIRAYEFLKRFEGEDTAKYWMRLARSKIEEGRKLGLDMEDLSYFQTYTGEGYRRVNSQLRSGVVDDEVYEYSTRMHRTLKKLLDHHGVTYRGADLTPDQAEKYTKGKIVIETAFTSTSTNKESAKYAISSHKFIIVGKHGKNLASVSKYPHEKEVLFDKNTGFRVRERDGNTIYLEEVEF